ncbi:hypothetical protein Acor_30280 [Acrocarpospora corrugata]|uniref:Uncharacterized protein n=1 Tax=Acrocarpospora corrugata TaxID=35763 RepID=A0A5M3VX07_9ACTN|nr:hypothetical protein [Acrocarpospora corrugata]GES00964.1 hypothetical protein Acor_30280 [Acrocarpospora corrugata]
MEVSGWALGGAFADRPVLGGEVGDVDATVVTSGVFLATILGFVLYLSLSRTDEIPVTAR